MFKKAPTNHPLLLEMFYGFEKEKANQVFLSEPFAGKAVSHTWQEAGMSIRKMAAALLALNLPAGSRMAIIGKNSAHWIMADLAITMAGHVAVPIYPTVTAATLCQILTHSESQVLFVGKLDAIEPLQSGIPGAVKCIHFPHWAWPGCEAWDSFSKGVDPIRTHFIPDPQSLSCILYTSGTTGDPKGVMHTHFAHSFSLLTVLDALGEELKDEVFFSYLPLSHIAERMVVEYCGIFTGGTIYFPESLATFSRDLEAAQPTIFLAVPRIWEKFREEILKKIPQHRLNILLNIPLLGSLLKKLMRKKLGLSRVRYALSGASPLHPSVPIWFSKLGIIIQEAYGMTENMALSTINRKATARFGTVGQSYKGVELFLGADNEVMVKSQANMIGYYKEPELTAASFEDGFLKTGDEGRLDQDGYLTITGRIKDLFKTSKGKYVAPAPIEERLLEHPIISQACVVGSGESHALALCMLSPDANSDRDQLQQLLSTIRQQINLEVEHHQQLAKLIIVRDEWTIANGFLTPTLKIRRGAVDAHYGPRYAAWLLMKEEIIFGSAAMV
ncbi:MAG: AMP-binding protein [Bacteroidetes bacterium]|nr:AMP-binding protein [Bacteroidota bacterium]